MNRPLYYYIWKCCMACMMTPGTATAMAEPDPAALAAPDNAAITAPDPEDEDYIVDTVAKYPKNTAEGQNVSTQVLEGRYRGRSEDFTSKWYDHLFMEAGAGVYRIVPPTPEAEILPLTAVHIGMGKVLGRYHTVRALAEGVIGYQKGIEHPLWRMGGRVDYLFNMTAHAKGYDPLRPLELQFMAGIGIGRNMMSGQEARTVPEAHVGLQLKLLSGAYGNMTIEPYVGVTADKADYSTTNWKRYDILYGVNVSMTHFVRNNMSPRQRAERAAAGGGAAPWFAQMSMGMTMYRAAAEYLPEHREAGETYADDAGGRIYRGQEVSLSVGKWVSAAIGLRGTLAVSSVGWQSAATEEVMSTFTPSYGKTYYTANTAFRVEAMVNPWGFVRDYDWQRSWGAYLLGGLGLNHTSRDMPDGQRLRVTSQMYSAGAHLYVRLRRDGIHLFVEPRYSKVVYRIPYRRVYRGRIYDDDYYTVNMGLSFELWDGARHQGTSRAQSRADDKGRARYMPQRYTVGMAGSMPFINHRGAAMDDGAGTDYGGRIFARYSISRLSGVRIGAEYMAIHTAAVADYYDVVWQQGEEAARMRQGLYNYNSGIVALTAGYSLDVARLLDREDRYADSAWGAEAHIGVGAAFAISSKGELSAGERLLDGHTATLAAEPQRATALIASLGVRLSYAITRHVGIYAEPMIYYVGDMPLPGAGIRGWGSLSSVSLGVQYGF